MNNLLEELYDRRGFGIKPGLERSKCLVDALGSPQDDFLCVHIAGTNGKGSVAAFIELTLRYLGFTTGLYTSPHFQTFNERFKIDGVNISDTELSLLIENTMAVLDPLERKSALGSYTFFEITTAMAFQHFSNKGVQVGIIETGMGGRWDSTNVVNAAVSVITTIDFDHMEYLGNSIAQIAAEKAGIIKEGSTTIVGDLSAEALDVVAQHVEESSARMVEAKKVVSMHSIPDNKGEKHSYGIESMNNDYGRIMLGLDGAHQAGNAAIALVALEVLVEKMGIELPRDIVRKAFKECHLTGRLQTINEDPPVIIDCAHNYAGVQSLCDHLIKRYPRQSIGVVYGACDDKEAEKCLLALGEIAERFWLVPIDSNRSSNPADLMLVAQQSDALCEIATPTMAMEDAVKWAESEGCVVVIAGSIFLLGEILHYVESQKDVDAG